MNWWFLVTALGAEIIGTIAGFGSSMVFLPLALLFVNFQTALVLVAFLHIFGNIGRISFFHHGLDKHMLIQFGVPSVIATVFGALLVSFTSPTLLKGMLGIYLVIYALISLWKDTIYIDASKIAAIIGGGLSGFLAGLIGTGGALRGAFLTAFRLHKNQYIATAAAIALIVDLTRIPIYLQQGFLPSQYYIVVPFLLITALLGSFIGKKIVEHIPQQQFRKLVLLAILVVGIKFVGDFV